jgi:hypothetical protein
MAWTNDLVLDLIEEYRKGPCLLNPTEFEYKLTNIKTDACKEIAGAFEGDSVEIRKLINPLLASFI